MRRYLSEKEIAAETDLGYHLKHADTIFAARVFGTSAVSKVPPEKAGRRDDAKGRGAKGRGAKSRDEKFETNAQAKIAKARS